MRASWANLYGARAELVSKTTPADVQKGPAYTVHSLNVYGDDGDLVATVDVYTDRLTVSTHPSVKILGSAD